MKPLSVIALGLALLLPVVLAADDKKDDKAAKLVGTWEITKVMSPPLPGMPAEDNPKRHGETFTFTKNGKLFFAAKLDGKELAVEGTYKLEGDRLIEKLRGFFNEDLSSTESIKKLTDDELVLVSGDTVTSLRRKKEKVPAALAADDKKNDKAAKLLGTWMIAGDAGLRGPTLTYAEDGKLLVAQKNRDGVIFKLEGTYKLEGDKLITKLAGFFNEDLSETAKIKKLTDDELVLVNGDAVTTLRRKKE